MFNLALEGVIRSSGINRQGTLNTKSHRCLAYADDVILMANSNKELSRITTNLIEDAAKIGLQINQGKTEYMQLKNKHYPNNETLKIQTTGSEAITFKQTEDYVYLGAWINNKCEEGPEIDFRMAKSNRCMASLQKTIKNKELSWGSKIRIYKRVIRPTMLHGSETWTLTKSEETKIQV